MAFNAGTIVAEMGIDTRKFDTGVSRLKGQFRQLEDAPRGAGSSVRGLGQSFTAMKGLAIGAMAIVTGKVFSFIASTVEMSARVKETQNLFEVSFGAMAASAEEWARRVSDATGVADFKLKEQAATLFKIQTNMGVTQDAAFSFSTALTQLAGDLASLNNIGTDEAFEKLKAGIVGSSEPLLSLGINVQDNAIKQTEFAQAILATGRELTNEEKVVARVQAILRQTTKDQGDLVRTQNSLANQTKLLSEDWLKFKAAMGDIFAPAGKVVIGILREMLNPLVLLGDTFNVVKGFALDFAADFVDVFSQTLPKALATFFDAAAILPGGMGEIATRTADSLRNFGLEAERVAEGLRTTSSEAFLSVTAAVEQNTSALQEIARVYDIADDATVEYASAASRAEAATREATAQLVSIAEPLEMTRRGMVDMTTATQDYDRRMSTGNETTRAANVSLSDLGGVFGETTGLMRLFGVESDSTFGKILGWAQKAFDAFTGILGLIGKLAGGIGGLGNLFGGGGGGGLLSGLVGGGGGGGGGVGGFLGNIFGGLPGVGLIAGLGGAAIAGLTGLFGGGPDIQRDVQRDQGVAISDELAKTIEQSNINQQAFVGQIFQEALANGTFDVNRLAEEMGDIFSAVDAGLLTSAQGEQALNAALPLLLQNVGDLSAQGQEQINRLLSATEQFGFGEQAAQQIVEALGRAPAPGPGASPGTPSFSSPTSGGGGGSGGSGGVGNRVTIENKFEINIDVDGVLGASPEVRQEMANLTGESVRNREGEIVGAITEALEGIFQKQ